jgi:hypothetical protein
MQIFLMINVISFAWYYFDYGILALLGMILLFDSEGEIYDCD